MNQSELEQLARKIAKSMRLGDNIFLTGDLGSGKSVFARALLRALGVRGNIPSPSFIVDAVYNIGEKDIHHIDLYRLEGNPYELELYGIFEVLDSNSMSVVEWADRLEEEIMTDGILLKLDFADDPYSRKVEVNDRRMVGN